MSTITRAQLRARVRRYADMRNTDQGLLDTDLNDMINDMAAEYYDKLVAIRGHSFFEQEYAVFTNAGTAVYTLPDDFFQLSTVTLEWAADNHELVYPLASNRYIPEFRNASIQWSDNDSKGYRITGTAAGAKTLTFFPTPTSAVRVRMRYIPVFAPLTADSGAGGLLEAENAWHKMVTLAVAAEFRGLLGLPNERLLGWRDEQIQRVLELATERLQDDPAEVVDVELGQRRWYPYPRWNSGA